MFVIKGYFGTLPGWFTPDGCFSSAPWRAKQYPTREEADAIRIPLFERAEEVARIMKYTPGKPWVTEEVTDPEMFVEPEYDPLEPGF
jgi:hypothetical protein